MLNDEIASYAKYIIEKSGGPSPYYMEVPQDFVVPAVYFPQPEISSFPHTLSGYAIEYAWYVKFFAADSPNAMKMAYDALSAVQEQRNAIPLVNEQGMETGGILRVKEPVARVVGEGVAQLYLRWESHWLYDAADVEKVTDIFVETHLKNAYGIAMERI